MLLGKLAAVSVDVSSLANTSSGLTTLSMQTASGQAASAVQLEFQTSSDIEITGVKSNVEGMQVFSGVVDGLFKVGLIDMTGQNTIPAGQHDVVTITYASTPSTSSYASTGSARTEGEIKLVNAIVVGTDAEKMNVTINRSSVLLGSPNATLPTAFSLAQNIPNPFNPTTNISFAVPQATNVRLEVLNVLGQKVRTLVDEFKAAGNYSITWDGKDDNYQSVASGVYLYRIAAGEFSETRKMILMK